MAKTAVINRDLKRRVIVKKFTKKRAMLQAIIDNAKMSDEDRLAARRKLQMLPRDASPTRLRAGIRTKVAASPRQVSRLSWLSLTTRSCGSSELLMRY